MREGGLINDLQYFNSRMLSLLFFSMNHAVH